jgi:hypothetical protein
MTRAMTCLSSSSRRLAATVALFALIASSTSATAHADEIVETERNSVPLLVTGIGVGTVGLVGLGTGTGLLIAARNECFDNGRRASALYPQYPEAYELGYDACMGESAMHPGGIAALVAGGAFLSIGLTFVIVGASSVPTRVKTAPEVSLGPGSARVRMAF